MDSEANGGAAAGPSMQAVVQDTYGSADVLRLARIAPPEVADNEVLLRVRAAGLDRGTWHLMSGRPYLLRLVFGLRRPRNRGARAIVAGTVVEVGSAVTRFSAGDEVFGVGPGSLAEYAVAREDKLARKPVNASFEQAAVVPVSAMTALQALCDAGRVQQGQKVLIIGASGGVGSYAVQLAKAIGAEVTGVGSTAKLDLVRSLGADHVIDYTRRRLRRWRAPLRPDPRHRRQRRPVTAPSRAHAVRDGRHHRRRGGRRLLTGGMNRQFRALALSLFVRQRLTFFVAKERSSDLERLTEFIETGKVTPSIDRIYPLAETPDAMRYLAAGKARGKIAISI